MGKKDVEAGEKVWLDAFNSGDAAGVAKQYTENARLMAPNSETIEGRAAIEGFVKEFVATGAKLKFALLTVHESSDMCASVGTYVMDLPGDAKDNGKFIEVWQKQGDGSWLIADDIFNSDLPPAPA